LQTQQYAVLTQHRYHPRSRGANNVTLIDNTTRDGELRHTQTGKAVSSLCLATNRQNKGEEETQFHSVVCWDRRVGTQRDDAFAAGGVLSLEGYAELERAAAACWKMSLC
jgi:hypothetical protein